MEENNSCQIPQNINPIPSPASKKSGAKPILVLVGILGAFVLGYFVDNAFGKMLPFNFFNQTKIEQTKDQPKQESTAANNTDKSTSQEPNQVTMNALTPEAATKKAIDYINTNYDTTKSSTLNRIESGMISLYAFNVNYNGQVVPAWVSTDGRWFFGQGPIDMTAPATNSTGGPAGTATIGNFTQVTDATVCKENGKPIVYFFGSSTCPHCQWEEPVIEAVAQLFNGYISFHEKIDDFGTDQAVFSKYNAGGGVPTLVLGCKYYRIGSGESDGTTVETANLKKLICNLTNNLPSTACQ
jgi:thiol-disulfide isomerase/thioredoxin